MGMSSWVLFLSSSWFAETASAYGIICHNYYLHLELQVKNLILQWLEFGLGMWANQSEILTQLAEDKGRWTVDGGQPLLPTGFIWVFLKASGWLLSKAKCWTRWANDLIWQVCCTYEGRMLPRIGYKLCAGMYLEKQLWEGVIIVKNWGRTVPLILSLPSTYLSQNPWKRNAIEIPPLLFHCQ